MEVSKKVTPGVRMAAVKAARKLTIDDVEIGTKPEHFWVRGDGMLMVQANVQLTQEQIVAEHPDRPGGGPERRWSERRGHGRRYGRSIGKTRDGPDARQAADRRSAERRSPPTENTAGFFARTFGPSLGLASPRE